jgi:quinol-cytochrome oxidoreductase complex cytochrome b subunit
MTRIVVKYSLINIVNGIVIDLATPANISYMWNFGSLLGVCVIGQIASGFFLSLQYNSGLQYAFGSVEHVMRDVRGGWWVRYVHANGASVLFALLCLHVRRGLFYGSYVKPRGVVWLLGVIMLRVIFLIAFRGYVLPWGQMSFWGATVITSIRSAVPYVGADRVIWVWGGYSVEGPTRVRVYSLHYVAPFVLLVFMLLHRAALHVDGSSNPLGVRSSEDKLPFHPYYVWKDVVGVGIMLRSIGVLVFGFPRLLGHTDNGVEADPLVTPGHIQPEWYFLPYYAIRRSVPMKLIGVVLMGISLLVLLFIPVINTSFVRSSSWRPLGRGFLSLWVANVILRGWIGAQATESPYDTISAIARLFYFAYFPLTLAVSLVEGVGYFGRKDKTQELILSDTYRKIKRAPPLKN